VSDAAAPLMPERYGQPAPWRRTAIIVASGLVGLLGLTWLGWTTVFHATPDVSSQLVGYEVVDDNGVRTTIYVSLAGDPVAMGVSCQVRAIAADHTVVGELGFTPEPGNNQLVVRTERRATSVENVGCTTPDQHRPR
jgi:hypothetical protein